jgi:hypothetical protein
MILEKLTDTDRLQEAVDKQIANVELGLLLGGLALVGLLVLSSVVIPAVASRTK